MKTIAHLCLLLALVPPGCAADSASEKQAEPILKAQAEDVRKKQIEAAREKEADDIREMLFRMEFETPSARRKSVKVFFLAIGENDADPTDEFMKRFEGHQPPVRKMSQRSFDRRSFDVIDAKTGGEGRIFRVKNLVWKSDTEIEVESSCYAGLLDASGATYTLKKVDGKWKIAGLLSLWVS